MWDAGCGDPHSASCIAIRSFLLIEYDEGDRDEVEAKEVVPFEHGAMPYFVEDVEENETVSEVASMQSI